MDTTMTEKDSAREAVAWQWREDPCHNGVWTDWEPISKEMFDVLTVIFAGRETVHIAGRPSREDNEGWPTQIRALHPASVVASLEAEGMRLRGQLNRLHDLLEGFDIRVGRNELFPPATYLDEVQITQEFQPGQGRIVADAIIDCLTKERT